MRLLWLLAPVKACPLHGVKLIEEPWKSEPPSSAEGKGPRGDGARAMPPGTLRGTAASGFDVEISRIIADLLEDTLVFPRPSLERSAQSAFLEYAADTLFDGKAAHLAKHIGVNKSLMHASLKGTENINLHRLALIAYCCNCAIADILLGNKVRVSLRARPSNAPNQLLNRRSCAGREKRRSAVLERTRQFTEEYCRAHGAIASAGGYPSRRRVIANMRGRSCKRGSWRDYHAAQREAHARHGTRVRMKRGRCPIGSSGNKGGVTIRPHSDFL
jgi:hypothetical protein